ncbi:MAG: NUDIX hydrolase [Myxococcales bacterium]|nr:NUDIX hydrolase [Myxococcales bacterium]
MLVLTLAGSLALAGSASAQPAQPAQPASGAPRLPPAPGWSDAQVQSILDATLTVRLAPELAHLSPGESLALQKLLAAGGIIQKVYERQLHRDLDRAARQTRSDPRRATLYRLFHGPIATTLQNQREPFLAVDMPPPGGNVYPWDLRKPELDAYLEQHPKEAAALTDLRSVVARATPANLRRHLATLTRFPELAALHPGLRPALSARLRARRPATLYAVPYAVEYAEQMTAVSRLLHQAADAVVAEDWAFAKYLRNRARDLLTDDYEAGDAAWITGRFGNLNAQIGAYETYDDRLLGTRAYYSLSVLVRRKDESAALAAAMRGLQAIEDSLPYERHKTVRENSPVGVYDVVADFGQARSANTATILPNEAYLAERYGRTILLRANILRHPQLHETARALWTSAVAPAHSADLDIEGDFYRTLWHEVGHYLGVSTTVDGRSLDVALAADHNLLEELKADLVSLYAARALRKSGYYDEARLRAVYAGGILRVLQVNRPRRDQPYQSMQLMQWNWFLERGLLRFDAAAGKLIIAYDRYHDVVAGMLREVLALQSSGDRKLSDAFILRYSTWDEDLHGRVAAQLRATPTKRFRLLRYGALGE